MIFIDQSIESPCDIQTTFGYLCWCIAVGLEYFSVIRQVFGDSVVVFISLPMRMQRGVDDFIRSGLATEIKIVSKRYHSSRIGIHQWTPKGSGTDLSIDFEKQASINQFLRKHGITHYEGNLELFPNFLQTPILFDELIYAIHILDHF